MKRTVTSVILAAVLLCPACGMAAPKEGGVPVARDFTWGSIVSWFTSLFTGMATAQEGAVPPSAGAEQGGDLTELGTTWDANG